MQSHPHFRDLRYHTDAALADLLGIAIHERKTIHEWPLSLVQKLTLADGRALVYKSQLPPTVEPEFYAAASSPLLPGSQALGNLGDCAIMTFDWIDAPLLRDEAYSASALVHHGRRVIEQIGAITGDLPVYLDIGSAEKWAAECEFVFERLATLIADKRFTSVDPAGLSQVRGWAHSTSVVETVAYQSRLIHGDLTAEQVFVTPDGYRIIDWQRPMIAPPEIDLVVLLDRQKIDPYPFVDPVAIRLYWFLHLRWAVVAQHDLFPRERWPIFNQWAAEAVRHILT
ncbi:MAG: phosphotransferase [Chloroflexi bacterium]|nr:phosphotransferase [Chloroflexota bacterium]